MDWNSIYQSRITTAQEAVRAVKSNDRIFLTGNVSVPQKALAALVEYAPNLENVEICQALTIGPADYVKPEMEGHLRVNTLFISHNVRKAVQEGRADFTPVLLSEFPLLFKRGHLPLDVAIIHVSLPDEHGFCSMGVEVGLTKSPAESAKIIIAEVNQQMPRTLGTAPADGPAPRLLTPLALACAALALAPDLDILLATHRSVTHSIGAVVLAAVACGAVARALGSPPMRTGVVCGLTVASHIVLDWLGRDSNTPRGVMALWPISTAYFYSGVDLFAEVSRRYWNPEEFILRNAVSVARETLILGPITALCWWASHRSFASRGAHPKSEDPGLHLTRNPAKGEKRRAPSP